VIRGGYGHCRLARAPALDQRRRDAVNVVDIDAGSAVVFLHGLAGIWQNILAITQDHRVIALDLPGFGASPMPAGDHDAQASRHG
jgi:pimeloyl-ACP methyl ester carboxylesterase